MKIRLIAIIIIMVLCVTDLCLTYYYINKYKKWQPNKPYKMIERNPLLTFSWNNFGLHLGMFIGAVVIIALNYIIAKNAHWLFVCLLLAFLIFAMFNHTKNIGLLIKLIERYPLGHLPKAVFGKVIGNN